MTVQLNKSFFGSYPSGLSSLQIRVIVDMNQSLSQGSPWDRLYRYKLYTFRCWGWNFPRTRTSLGFMQYRARDVFLDFHVSFRADELFYRSKLRLESPRLAATFEGKFRRKKKPKKKFELTSKRLKQRRKAPKSKKWNHYSQDEKIKFIESYDFAENKAAWEKQNVNHGRISEWKRELGM